MNQELEQRLSILLKKVCQKKVTDSIKIVNIHRDKKLILEGVLFDDENTCFHSYENIKDIVTGFMVSATNYGIYIEDEFIGLVSLFYQHHKDLTRLEMAISIKKEYRNIKIGEFSYDYIIRNYLKNTDIKSIHLSIREDNIKSRRLAEKIGFKLYPGYKSCENFIDLNGNKIPQVQYLLKLKDYFK